MKKIFKYSENNRLIVIVYFLLFLLLGTVGIKGLMSERKINRSYDYIIDSTVYKLKLLREIRLNAERIQGITIDQILSPSDSITGNNEFLAKESLNQNTRNLDEYNKHIKTETEKQLFEQLLSYWQLNKQCWDTLAILKNNETKLVQYYIIKQKGVYNNFDASINRLVHFIYSDIYEKDKNIDNYTFTSRAIINLLIIVVIIFLLILGVLLLFDVKTLNRQNRLLKRSEELYRSLFHNSPVFIWVSELPTLKFLDVNATVISHFGYSRDEFLSMTAFDLLVEEDRKLVKERLQQGTTGYLGIDSHVKKNGELINVEIRVHMINYNGKKAGLVIGVDVTEKLKVEAELRHSEESYRLLFNKSPLPKWVCDRNTLRIYEINEAAIEQYGYSREEFLSLSVFDILLKEDHQKAKAFIQGNDFSKTIRVNRRHVKKNGEILNVEVMLNDILHNGKKELLVAVNDITQKLKAEEKLRREEEFYRTVMENSSDIQFVTNEKRKIIYASPSVYKNFGFQKEEIIGKTSNDFWHPDDIEATKEKIKELVTRPGHTIQVEVRILDRDKNYRWCEARMSNQLHNSVIKGYVSNYSEITGRKLAEKKIRSSEELYRSLFNKNPLPTLVVDKETLQFLQVNDAAVEVYGYSKEEFRKLSVFDLRRPQDHGYLNEVVEKKVIHNAMNYHVTHINKNGEPIIVDVALETIDYKGKEAFLAIVKDITQTLKLERQLSKEKLNKQIEITKATIGGQEKERNELGKELHDNVNQILATAKLYLESAATTPHKQSEFIEKGKNLVNSGINEIRRISKSLVPPSLGDLTLREALTELVDPIRLTKNKTELKIDGLDEEKLGNDLKISVYRIVQEQLNNILKYADASEICVIVNQTDRELELKITDNGKGFDPAKKRSGIGIINMINRATIFNGKIIIDSSPGNGCRVNANFSLNGKQKEISGSIPNPSPN